MWVFNIVGGVLLILGVAVFFASIVIPETRSKFAWAPKILVPLGILFLLVGQVLFYAHPGHFYVVQYISGTQKVVTGSGPKFRWFGQVIDFKQVLTLKFAKNDNGDPSGYDKPYTVRFNDAVMADVSASIRIRLPSDHSHLKKLAIEYRSQENLVAASLMPTIREVLRNSARMISAQDYIVGKGGIFEQAVIDQLQNGICELEIRTYRDSSRQNFMTDEQRTIDNGISVKTEVVKIRNAKGEEVRKKHAFLEYGIEVTQSVIDNVDRNFQPGRPRSRRTPKPIKRRLSCWQMVPLRRSWGLSSKSTRLTLMPSKAPNWCPVPLFHQTERGLLPLTW